MSSSNKFPPPQGEYAGQMPAFRRVSGLIQPDVPRFLHRGTGLGPKQLSHVCHLLWLPWVIKFRDFHPTNLIASTELHGIALSVSAVAVPPNLLSLVRYHSISASDCHPAMFYAGFCLFHLDEFRGNRGCDCTVCVCLRLRFDLPGFCRRFGL